MDRKEASPVLRYLRKLVPTPRAEAQDDVSLLECFVRRQDEDSFALILQRHGPVVWGVCRRLLRSEEDAEDAFQATFLVLVRKAKTISRPAQLANWLYGVACRTAARAHVEAARRRRHELGAVSRPAPESVDEVMWRDLCPVLDEEIERLPRRYRTPFVLCCLEGLTNRAAATQLGCPEGTVASRLAWARQRLRARLTRRGVSLSVVLLTTLLPRNTLPAALADSTVKAAMLSASGGAGGTAVAPAVANLIEGVLHSMFIAKLKLGSAVILAVALLGTTAGVFAFRGQAAGPGTDNTEQTLKRSAEGGERAVAAPKRGQAQLIQMQLEAAQKELVQVQSDLRKAHVELSLAMKKQKTERLDGRFAVSLDEVAQLTAEDPEISQLRSHATELDAKLRQFERFITDPEKKTKSLKEQKLQIEKKIEQRTGELRTRYEARLRDAARREAARPIVKHQERIEYLKELEKVLTEDVLRLSEQANAQPESVEQRLNNLEREVRRLSLTLREGKEKK